MSRLPRTITLVGITAALTISGAWGVRLVTARLGAQTGAPTLIDPLVIPRLQWRSLGPQRGGRSITVSGVKGQPDVGYFGATGGGLWKTTDRGETWTPVTDGQITSSSVGAMAVSETNPSIVFIGTGEQCIRGNIQPGDGAYKSVDAGKTWTYIGFRDGQNIAKIRIHPTNPDTVFVAVFGHYGAPNPERGIYKTTDGGRTWRQVLHRDDKTAGVDVWIDHNNPTVVFAALWEAYRMEYQMSSGGPGSGLYKSTDGGEHFAEITHNPGLPSGIDGKIGVSVSGADSNRVFAIVENEAGGVFRSDDAGATWTKTNEGRNLRQRAFYYTHIIADPHNKELVYALDVGAFRSQDGGKTFSSFAGGDSHELWIDPDDSNHVMHASDSGGAVTYTALTQATWSARDYPTGQYYHVVTTAHLPYHICGAQQDSSTVCLPSNMGLAGAGAAAGGGRGGGGGGGGRGGGAPAAPTTYGPGGSEPGYIAPDPKDPDVFFSGANNGGFMDRLNRRTGETREVHPYPRMFSGEPSSALVERVQWTYPIIFSPVDPRVLYTATQHVWRTTTQGQTWDRISDDLTRHDPKTMTDSGGPITHDMNGPEVYATVYALGPSKKDVNVLWAGSDDGYVQVTRNGGRSWKNVTPKDMPDFGRVSIIDASAFDAGTAYVAVKKPLLDDFAPYIFRTHDYGETWTRIVSGIRANDYAHAVREDQTRRGLLYAGTQHGFYVSFDDGDHWQSLSLNLPDVQVCDIAVTDNDIAISTHGRGFYILDHIQAMRESGPALSGADAYLFKPEPAIRSATQATIMYLLRKPAQALKIEIIDPKGTVVQTFTGGAVAPGGAAAAAAAELAIVAGRARGAGAGAAAGGGAGAAGVGARGAGAGAAVPPPGGAGAGAAGAGAVPQGGGGGRGGRGGGAGGPQGAPMGAGFNTVSWGMRYPGGTTFPGMILWGGNMGTGPMAAPGTYQVRMTADGKTQTQPLVIKRHPLHEATDADLQEQFDLAMQVLDKASEANKAVIQIRAIKTQVADRLSKSSDAPLKAAGDRLTKSLSAVEEDIYQVKNQAGQDPLNFPIKLNNRLATLYSVVTQGDGKPIGNAVPIFKDLTAELKVQTDRLAKALGTDLTAFNTEAKRLGLDVVTEK
jgi:photosystem II stability/assembly factor-like uncharacterized protein